MKLSPLAVAAMFALVCRAVHADSFHVSKVSWVNNALQIEVQTDLPDGADLYVGIADEKTGNNLISESIFVRVNGGRFVAEGFTEARDVTPLKAGRYWLSIAEYDFSSIVRVLPITVPQNGQNAAEKKNTVQRKSKKDAGFLRDPDMSQDEITFWANTIIVMVNSGELVMECDNNRAYINPNTWTAGEGGGVWSAQRRLARAILLACHGASGSDRVDIYDGETRQKLASYSRAGGYTQY